MRRFLPAHLVAALALGAAVAAPATAQDPLNDAVNGAIDGAQQTLGGVTGSTGDPAGAGGTANGAVDEVQRRATGGSAGSGSPPPSGAAGGGSTAAPSGGGADGGTSSSGATGGGGSAGGGGGGDGDGGGPGRDRGDRRDGRGGRAATPARGDERRTPEVAGNARGDDDGFLTRTVRDIREVVPTTIWVLIGVLALLALAFGARSLFLGSRARRLTRQREALKRDVGLLQQALLPDVPEKVGTLATSVAYRPADGPAAGGDFYDVFELSGGCVAIIVGDVSGHGHQALNRSASMRYTLRAYVDAGATPRDALKLAAKSMGDSFEDFTTVVLAIHDPEAATLTYATAGHPAPVMLGSARHEVVTACASPPVGAGLPTGQRQTTVPFDEGALACFFTDGLIEARDAGGLLGEPRLAQLVGDLGDEVNAQALLERVLAVADQANDDMAACVIKATAGKAEHVRVEELEVEPSEVAAPAVERFLSACGLDAEGMAEAIRSARKCSVQAGAAVIRVHIGDAAKPRVDVVAPDRRRVNVAAVEPADLLAAG